MMEGQREVPAYKPVRRISTVLPLTLLANSLPIAVSPARAENYALDQSPGPSNAATIKEVTAALLRTDARHIRLLRYVGCGTGSCTYWQL